MQQVSQPAPFALKTQSSASNPSAPREDRDRRESFDEVYGEGSSTRSDADSRDSASDASYAAVEASSSSRESKPSQSAPRARTANDQISQQQSAEMPRAAGEGSNVQAGDPEAADESLFSSKATKTGFASSPLVSPNGVQNSTTVQEEVIATPDTGVAEGSDSKTQGLDAKQARGIEASQLGNTAKVAGAGRVSEQAVQLSQNPADGDPSKAVQSDTVPKGVSNAVAALLPDTSRTAALMEGRRAAALVSENSPRGTAQNQTLIALSGDEAALGSEALPKDPSRLSEVDLPTTPRGPGWSVEAATDAKQDMFLQPSDRIQTLGNTSSETAIKLSTVDDLGALGLDRPDELFPATNGSERVTGVNGTVNSVAQSRSVSYPHLAAQLRENLPIPPNKPVEIALSPEELGRVRMVVTQVEAGVAIQITAERQETLDLMRRNLDDLTSDLENLGYTEMSFSFDQEGEAFSEFGQADDEGSAEHLTLTSTDTATLHAENRANLSSRPGGLDLRL